MTEPARPGIIKRVFRIVPASYWLAGLIAAGVVSWMVSDDILPGPPEGIKQVVVSESNEDDKKSFIVSAVKVINEKTNIFVRASGATEPTFSIDVIARRNGLVTQILVNEGTDVSEGQILAILDKETLLTDLEAAIAAEKSAKQSFEIAEKLGKQNFASSLDLIQSEAALKQAQAQVASIRQQLDFTELRAPKSGKLEILSLESGQFVQKDRTVATILGMNPMKLIAPVPQTQVGKISVGNEVIIAIPGTQEKKGFVKKVASSANEATRTFDVEIEIDNTDGSVRSGMSSEVSIIIDNAEAFLVSPAHLAISEDGSLKVKLVDDINVVKIIDVNLVRASGNMAFVSGLKDGDLMLTTGQAFVSEGEEIEFELEKGN